MQATPEIVIRREVASDYDKIFSLNEAAFGENAEARLVNCLRRDDPLAISLVADVDKQVCGHIMFSSAKIVPLDNTVNNSRHPVIMGLAPMAVAETHRNRGIGSRLVESGLRECRSAGAEAAVVLGHPDYYPRFGFSPASEFGLGCEFDVPDNAFLAIELLPGALSKCQGTVHYHPAFATL